MSFLFNALACWEDTLPLECGLSLTSAKCGNDALSEGFLSKHLTDEGFSNALE